MNGSMNHFINNYKYTSFIICTLLVACSVGNMPKSRSEFIKQYAGNEEQYPCDPLKYDSKLTIHHQLLWKTTQCCQLRAGYAWDT